MLQIFFKPSLTLLLKVSYYENKKEKEHLKDFLPINKTSHFSSFSVISYFLSINPCFTQPIGSFSTEIWYQTPLSVFASRKIFKFSRL